jgi:hypothetical protein
MILAAAAGLLAGEGRARADGAFPDSMQLLLPADRPREIVLATNFGLISSEDDGQTWVWACEPDLNDNAILYQVSAAPSDRMFAVLLRRGLVYSDDGACTWTSAAGQLATAVASDVFADPTNPARVFAIGAENGDGRTPQSLYRSDDGGLTFGAPLFSAPTAGGLLSVESAVSDPLTIYLSMYTTPMVHPFLVRSADGGAQWTSVDLEPAIGVNSFRIAAVDPEDPRKIYLRVSEALGEHLAVSADGGATFAEPVFTDGTLTAFARLASGTVLVGVSSSSASGDGGVPSTGYRSNDGGVTFQPWSGAPHLRALAERDGKLFAAADNFRDGFAVGVSTDEGLSFQPLVTYDQVMRIKPCVQQVCRDICDMSLGGLLWSPDVCSGTLGDGGEGGDARGGGDGPSKATVSSGCGCSAGGARGAPRAGAIDRAVEGGGALGAGAALLLASLVARRRPPGRRG